MNTKLMIGLLLGGSLLCTACAPPKVLVSNDVKTKYLLQQAETKQGGKRLFNFFVRVCDSAAERSVNCKDSMVLDNVVAQSIY